jgi:hypothetical protein
MSGDEGGLMVDGRHRFFREAAALLERAAQTDDPREASELVKQAADILALLAEFERVSSPNGGVPLALDTQ